MRGPATSAVAAAWQTLAALAGQSVAQPASDFGSDVSVSLATAAAAIVAASLWLALRAPRSGACQTAEERRLVHRLVAQSPPDSLAYFALRRDKTYFFEKDRRAALAYRAAAGIVLVSGDPVGDPAAFDDLLAQFAALCRTKAWRIAVIGVAAEHARPPGLASGCARSTSATRPWSSPSGSRSKGDRSARCGSRCTVSGERATGCGWRRPARSARRSGRRCTRSRLPTGPTCPCRASPWRPTICVPTSSRTRCSCWLRTPRAVWPAFCTSCRCRARPPCLSAP